MTTTQRAGRINRYDRGYNQDRVSPLPESIDTETFSNRRPINDYNEDEKYLYNSRRDNRGSRGNRGIKESRIRKEEFLPRPFDEGGLNEIDRQ